MFCCDEVVIAKKKGNNSERFEFESFWVTAIKSEVCFNLF